MSGPFPYAITAAPEGGAVAWVLNDRGTRNIWVAEPPGYEGRALTDYTGDDGQELSGLTWTPDGRTLVYARGGNANPTSDPAGVEQALWRVALDGGDPVRLGPGGNATMAPDGSGFASSRQGQIWFTPLDGSGETRSLAQVRGGAGSLTWSPDGRRIAFISNRGTHAFLGVLDLDRETIEWMDPSVDRDRDPVWSPDGARLAFIRVAADTEIRSFQAVREAYPWSIRIAEVETGESTELWRADEGVGSRFWGVTASNQLQWAAGDRIVFPWEGTGWLHLYSIPAGGGEPIPLTAGEFEVEDVILSPDRERIYYSSNQTDLDPDDLHRRHIWRVPVDGGSPEALTSGEGIEWEPRPLSDGGLAFLRSGPRTPGHAAVRLSDEPRPMIAAGDPGGIPTDFPTEALVVPEPVTLTAADGMKVPAQLFLPHDLQAGERRPAIAFFHGGSRRQMLLGFHYRSYYHYSYALNQYLAARGYIVLSVNFRSGTGYGMEFREALDYGAGGGSEFHDVIGAGVWLEARDDVDPERIGLWGGSYGGYLTAMGLSRASELYAAGVDFHGVHDWNVGIRTFRPDWDPDPETEALAFESSPMATLDGWRSPVLLVHGDDDRNVRFVETVALVEALREREVHVEQLVFPDEVHSFLLHRNWITSYEATADFFRRKLGR